MDDISSIVIGYRHTGIICKDMANSLHFYRDILGFQIIQDFWDDSEYINKITGIVGANVHMVKLKALDGTVIELLDYATHQTELIDMPIYNVGACHLALRVANAEAAYCRLKTENISMLSEPVLSSEGFAKVFFCLDPNNLRVELVEMLIC